MNNYRIQIEPIGIINSELKEAEGSPIQPTFAKTKGVVQIFEKYKEGLKDLESFDRIWLIYQFNRCGGYKMSVTPYMDTEKRGLFATRAPSRPNFIGISSVKLEKVDGCLLYVSEVDILDQTPLLDIKPYNPKFDCFETSKNGWLDKADVEKNIADKRFHQT